MNTDAPNRVLVRRQRGTRTVRTGEQNDRLRTGRVAGTGRAAYRLDVLPADTDVPAGVLNRREQNDYPRWEERLPGEFGDARRARPPRNGRVRLLAPTILTTERHVRRPRRSKRGRRAVPTGVRRDAPEPNGPRHANDRLLIGRPADCCPPGVVPGGKPKRRGDGRIQR